MSHQLELQTELKEIIKDTLPGINFDSPAKIKPDEEEDSLIPKQTHEDSQPPKPTQPQLIHVQENEVIDPLHQLVANNDVVPLLAVIDKIDLSLQVQGKPLLSRLCSMQLPLSRLLSGRQFTFKKDSANRTALHEAILADDIPSVHFCLENRIENVKDQHGHTPILQAIKLGRRAAFLLCLHYHYYDNLAPHYCAKYNRAWELKILHRLGYNVVSQRDNQFFLPIERAVENYAYDATQFLTEISQNVDSNELQKKTDSKAIIRMVNRVNKENSILSQIIFPFFWVFIHIFIIFMLTNYPIFQNQAPEIQSACGLISILYILMITVSLVTSSEHDSSAGVDLLALLQAPHFPPLKDTCPHCLQFRQTNKQHCKRCNNCVQKLHFHTFMCVNGKNEVFWFLVQICWFWLLRKLNSIFMNTLIANNLNLNAFSYNFFFSNASIIDYLYTNQMFTQLLQYSYIKAFLIYQFFVLFQWICMLVLNRTHLEINNTEKFTKFYRIVKTQEGSYKSQEIRLMEKGMLFGVIRGLWNALRYFFM